MRYKSRRSKATDITIEVRQEVLLRDNGICVFCKRQNGIPNAHYIPRSKGGLGIVQNVVSLCPECHYAFDFTTRHKEVGDVVKAHLEAHYPDFTDEQRIYKKGAL